MIAVISGDGILDIFKQVNMETVALIVTGFYLVLIPLILWKCWKDLEDEEIS